MEVGTDQKWSENMWLCFKPISSCMLCKRLYDTVLTKQLYLRIVKKHIEMQKGRGLVAS